MVIGEILVSRTAFLAHGVIVISCTKNCLVTPPINARLGILKRSMSLPQSDSEENSYELFDALPVEGTPRDENIRLNEERSIIASTIALHGVQVL